MSTINAKVMATKGKEEKEFYNQQDMELADHQDSASKEHLRAHSRPSSTR